MMRNRRRIKWIALVVPAMAWTSTAFGQATGPLPPPTAESAENESTIDAATPAVDETTRSAGGVRFDAEAAAGDDLDAAVERLLAAMSRAEKIGQMCQVTHEGAPGDDVTLTPALRDAIRAGRVGSLLNAPNQAFIAEAQRLARDESPRGIPLLIGRDVIHGYRTVFPIPLGQAASWHPELIERAAKVAADEARAHGINWTFAPMVDICRDPRWGRIAETLGEDPHLASALAVAMVRGFQQLDAGKIHGVVACVKHFAAYGLAEGGRDYDRASVSTVDLHNIYLPPFRAAAEAGCRTLMTTFSEVNGVPGTANEYLLQDVLRRGWQFRGFVVSDWNSIIEMIEHGFSADAAEAARQSVTAGVDMEMVSRTFHDHLATLVEQDAVPEAVIDDAVRRILRVKLELTPIGADEQRSRRDVLRPRSLELARKLARESLVLLKNVDETLPLDRDALRRVAVLGPLADAPLAQLGCWAIDGDAEDSVTPLEAIREALGDSADVMHVRGAAADFSSGVDEIAQAASAAADADVALVFVGEDALLSGEARSRATLGLPGRQRKLVRAVAATGKPVVLVVLAGRPLTIGAECEAADAVLYAWHPGTMGGPAIADVLLGAAAPSGKLPVTFPKTVGQAPLYYGHGNTGRPSPRDYESLARTKEKDLRTEFQYRSHYLDSDPFPLFPFGYGLSYTAFAYEPLVLSTAKIKLGQTLSVQARVTNTGDRAGAEVVQLYVRDVAARIVRPVKELKAFRRIYLRAGESSVVEFGLDADELGYVDASGQRVVEPGWFAIGVGGDSTVELDQKFELVGEPSTSPPASPSVAQAPGDEAIGRNGQRPVAAKADEGT